MTLWSLWSWLVQHVGVAGGLCAVAWLVSGLVSPILLVLLYRKSVSVERCLSELYDSLAAQKRQEQVARITYGTERPTRGRRR